MTPGEVGMTSAQDRNEWVRQRGEFRVTWRGYDRAEVEKCLRDLRSALHTVTAERDAVAEDVRRQSAELAALRAENLKLRERLDRVCRTPVETDGLSERLWHMVDLAQKEAQEILDKAQAEAERRREELDKREAELKLRRAELESEHRELVHRIKAEAAAEAEEAARKRREEDERAVRRRQELERDFAKSLAVRREEMNRALARREEAAKAEAERIVAEANARAERIVSQATARVRNLEAARRRAAAELRTAREALAGALPLIEPLPDEVTVDRTVKSGPPSMCGAGTGSGSRPAAHLVRRTANLPVQRVAGPTVSTTR